jgi:hypothetical protein
LLRSCRTRPVSLPAAASTLLALISTGN